MGPGAEASNAAAAQRPVGLDAGPCRSELPWCSLVLLLELSTGSCWAFKHQRSSNLSVGAPSTARHSAGSRARGCSITSVFIWGSAGWLLPHRGQRSPSPSPIPAPRDAGLEHLILQQSHRRGTARLVLVGSSGCEPRAASSPWSQPHSLGRAGFTSSQAQGQAQTLQRGRRGSGRSPGPADHTEHSLDEPSGAGKLLLGRAAAPARPWVGAESLQCQAAARDGCRLPLHPTSTGYALVRDAFL